MISQIILLQRCAESIESRGKDGIARAFILPFIFACALLLGETLCLLIFKSVFLIYRRRGVRVHRFINSNCQTFKIYSILSLFFFSLSLQDGSEDTKELTRGNRTFSPCILFFPAAIDMMGNVLLSHLITRIFSMSNEIILQPNR